MIRREFLMLGAVPFLPKFATAAALDTAGPLTRIVFGSCAHQEKPLPIWKAVLAAKPELVLMLGDNIYADTDDMTVMKEKYDKALANADYQALRKSATFLGTWDDHDYGKNDAGVEYPKKDESQQLFLDFFGVPKDSPLRKRKGVYNSAVFGPEGKRVQVIMLDGRYHRTALRRGKREPGMTYTPYIPSSDPAATILGEEQWAWLAEQFKVPAEIRLLVSGIQVVAEDHGFEKWMNFPAEREKLYNLIRDSKAGGVMILSGDRHLAELSMDPAAVGYPLYDLTSSGLNQADKNWRPVEKNRHRVATMSYGDNFGFIGIDWSGESPRISLQVRDVDGDVMIQQKVYLTDLQPGAQEGKKKDAKEPEPAKVSEGAVTPEQAAKMVGEKVTLEMRVAATGMGGTRLFLNSKANFRDEENFTVVVNQKALTGKLDKATGATFKGKVIKVTGTVSLFQKRPQLVVDEEMQIEIVEEKK